MKLLTKYTSIPGFLWRFTILKIGDLHIRIHYIHGKDQTQLVHNHPFNYASLVFFGSYVETVITNGNTLVLSRFFGDLILRSGDVSHRIENIGKFGCLTLFFAYGNFGWKAKNISTEFIDDGVYSRVVSGKVLWCKSSHGVWHIGNKDKAIATKETRHSIFQAEQ